MKKQLILIITVFVMLFTACTKAPQSTKKILNSEFKLDFLFENDGCKIYRFYDAGHAIYYSTCPGKVFYEVNGKNTHYRVDTSTGTQDTLIRYGEN